MFFLFFIKFKFCVICFFIICILLLFNVFGLERIFCGILVCLILCSNVFIVNFLMVFFL